MQLKRKLGSYFIHTPAYPNLVGFRLVDMYTRVLTSDKKEEVLTTFTNKDEFLLLVIAATALRMGVDCSDIRRIIHWEMPCTLKEYIQETGRSGRDVLPSEAILYRGQRSRYASTEAANYELNTSTCRHRLLNKECLMYSESDMCCCFVF